MYTKPRQAARSAKWRAKAAGHHVWPQFGEMDWQLERGITGDLMDVAANACKALRAEIPLRVAAPTVIGIDSQPVIEMAQLAGHKAARIRSLIIQE